MHQNSCMHVCHSCEINQGHKTKLNIFFNSSSQMNLRVHRWQSLYWGLLLIFFFVLRSFGIPFTQLWNIHWRSRWCYTGCVHKGTNHVLKDVSDRDPLRDWDRDLNCVRSQALQTPSQSRTGSAHCEVIFCSYCAVRADWPMHGLSMHFQNAHARITFRKSFAFTCPRIRLSTRIPIQNALFSRFKSLILKELCVHKG